jgi:hypothetical protein
VPRISTWALYTRKGASEESRCLQADEDEKVLLKALELGACFHHRLGAVDTDVEGQLGLGCSKVYRSRDNLKGSLSA